MPSSVKELASMSEALRMLGGRLRKNWQDPEIRRNIGLLALGKAIGLFLILTLITRWYLPGLLAAQDPTAAAAPALDPMNSINAINTVWTLVAAFLVFCMQVGFVMLEAGFARSRESVNILVEGIADTCICGITFWLWGFAFMFEPGTPWIGTTGFALQGLAPTYGSTGVPLLAFWVFQFAFADTCSTITSGAMIGRCGFVGDILYSIGVTGFIYPIIGPGARTAGWPPWGRLPFMTLQDRRWSTPSAARYRWPAPLPSVRDWGGSSSGMVAARCPLMT
jgi:Amt family ammonium transporter